MQLSYLILFRLVKKVYNGGMLYSTNNDLKQSVLKAWNEVTEEGRQRLLNSMQNRIFELITLQVINKILVQIFM